MTAYTPPVYWSGLVKVGINGFGRIGRLVFRALRGRAGIQVVHLNEPAGQVAAMGHLLEFDSVHGRWRESVNVEGETLYVGGQRITCSHSRDFTAVDWRAAGVETVLECSGRFKTVAALTPYFQQCGVERVIVACPVKGEEVLNVVYGVNHQQIDPTRHRILTAASCTTNCLAPMVKVVHETFGIVHGSMTTIHNLTNTQTPVDGYRGDLRRCRAAGESLIPTTTGSAKAIAMIFPELKGKLNGHAVRVALLNASLTDAVFELARPTSAKAVNDAFRLAAAGSLQGILGYEERPLVSVDYRHDNRSCIVDGPSTLVVDGTHLKVYGWYDNEWGYSCRMADLTCAVARST